MPSSDPRSVFRPLSKRELDELAAFLDTSSRAMALPRAIGFLTGVVTAPTLMKPSEWHRLVFGEPAFEDMHQAQRMLDLVTRLYNQIITCLDAGEALMSPGGHDEVGAWCAGYVEAARMDDTWRADEASVVALFPFAVLAEEIDLVGEEDSDGKIIEDASGHIGRARKMIGPGAVEIYRYWRERRVPPSSGPSRTVVRAAAKVGRNEPCPCGSGKKYKRCCAVTLH